MPSALIVIPCYNEAQRLQGRKFKEFLGAGPLHRLLVVNDGGADGTLKVLKALRDGASQHDDIYHLPMNVGKAEAVRIGEGFLWAR